ncbi:DEAD/DEAH box helicase [Cellulomonas fimi]|uniref:DEAD/DEAH box helicase n=1 Tax=Cellulomonas fimi TaxID=1708 RepID=UPI0023583372|nr:DEAD/DEAH box helicase [Cellulomonas fimi]
MADGYEALRTALAGPVIEDKFSLLGEIAAILDVGENRSQAVDLVIRALDRAHDFEAEAALLNALAMASGLYPYVPRGSREDPLIFRDRVLLELHRPHDGSDTVFHRVQAQVFRRLLDGQNVILSAPTSFGKSLIVDALLEAGQYRNVVIIVPTIALLDETRRRLSRQPGYKMITHPGQAYGEKNLLVLTQERFLALDEIPDVDLFFIDEFYKLSDNEPNGQLSGRSALLNRAVARLLKTGAQFYMAGPSISSLDDLLPEDFTASFVKTDFATVAADTVRLEANNDTERRAKILEVLAGSEEPTLIYCQSPARVRLVVKWLLEADAPERYGSGLPDAAEWVEQNYHPEWILPRAMRHGIGAHHGRLPRWLAQHMVDGFNRGDLGVLVCSNSLIEGVNTRAKRIIILDKNIARRAYSYFTFANIRGRAGRMLQHFVGTVYVFHDEPRGELPTIDVPVLTQSDAAPSSVLLDIDSAERTEQTQERLRPILEQDLVSEDTMAAVMGVEPEQQIELAKHLNGMPRARLAELQWTTAYPRYGQLEGLSSLIWNFIPPDYHQGHGPTSAKQLTRYIATASQADGRMRDVIADFTKDPNWWRAGEDLDDRIELAFDFVRFWVDHNFPQLVRAVDRIAADVLQSRGMTPGSFEAYAARVEANFAQPLFASVEEFGLPIEVTRKLAAKLRSADTLDDLLGRIRMVASQSLPELSPFERSLVARMVGEV